LKNLIAEVEDDFHFQVKMEAMRRKMTIKEYIVSLIRKDLGKENEQDAEQG